MTKQSPYKLENAVRPKVPFVTQRMPDDAVLFLQQDRGHLLYRNRTDVHQSQPRRFRSLQSLFLQCHVEELTSPPHPRHFLNGFRLAAGESLPGHMIGDFHCQEGGRKWSGSQASQQPHSALTQQQGPVTCQQPQLGQAPGWPVVQWVTARIYGISL